MRIQDLLDEYKTSLPEAPLGDFDALLDAEAARQLRRQQRRRIVLPIFLAVAAAVCLVLALPRKVELESIPVLPTSTLASMPLSVAVSSPPIVKARRRIRAIPAIAPATYSGEGGEYREFVPLAQSRLLPQSDVMQVLRVSVSSDRLAALGVPASTTYSGEGDNQIAAELLLGEDGLVRAVRVLR